METVEAQPTRAGTSRIAELQHLDSMRHLPISELQILAEYAVLRAYEPQTIITAEKSIARHVFLLIDGHVEQSVSDPEDTEITLAMFGRGDLFGEGGLFGVRYRRTTTHAITRSYVLQFAYNDLQAQADHLPHFFMALRIRFRERLLQTTLARVPLLAHLTPLERLSIAQQLDDRRIERAEKIIEAGGISEGLYIIAQGQATVEHSGHTVAVIEPGHIFGEMSLLDNAPHEATIVALTPVHILVLPRSTLEYLLAEHPDVAEGLQRLATERKQTDRTAEHIATTERLVETGIVRGRMALARRAELCQPNCHRCEDACAHRFGVARLHFGGTMFAELEAADTCHHCQWGAECAEACPEDAMRLDRDGVLVISDRCMGCGVCWEACPYDAINQVPVYAPTSNPLTWLLRHAGKVPPDHLRANKCDACSGYEDHACITACPTGALQWVPIEEFYRHPPQPAQTIHLNLD